MLSVSRIPINDAKELMGHSDISITPKIYTHMVDEVFEQNRKKLGQYTNKKTEICKRIKTKKR